jgi:DNA (cytosine-5)-methyltransferase 1
MKDLMEEPVLLSTRIHVFEHDRKFRVALYGPDNYKAAVISHYSYSKDKKLKKAALEYAKQLFEGYLEVEITNQVAEEAIQDLFGFEKIPFPKPLRPEFQFIDLFAGIGGFRIAMQGLGGECVFSSEWDKDAQITYLKNFGELPFGDITRPEVKKWIPEKFDVLCAGFPCQPFSLAGVSKKNSLGRAHGFLDKTQGTLFYDIVEILGKHRPKAFILENVKNLRSHDKGQTYKVIKESLKELNYITFDEIIDAKYYVPQHRERIFIVGFNRDFFKDTIDFKFPTAPDETTRIKDILEKKPDPKYTLTDHLWNYLQNYAKKHAAQGNGFGFGLVDLNKHSRTLSARYHKDGSEILIPQGKGKNPRRLSPNECRALMGYPENYRVYDTGVSHTQLYRQFGNSVVVPVVEAVAASVIKVLEKY